jgi:hypothetical protein
MPMDLRRTAFENERRRQIDQIKASIQPW